MSTTSSQTVKETGAAPGQYLVGVEEQPLNRGLRIKVHKAQSKDGGRIEGSFDLMAAGTGTYARFLAPHVGDSFIDAAELLDAIRQDGGDALACTHLLNRNNLRVEPKDDPGHA